MKKIVAAVLLIMFFSPVYASDGFYLEGMFGTATHEPDLEEFGLAGVEQSSGTYGMFLGYKFNKHFAVELGWQSYGDAKFNSNITYQGVNMDLTLESTDINALKYGVRGIIPLGEKFSLSGRLGLSTLNGNRKATATSTQSPYISASEIDSSSVSAVYVGLGAEYSLNEQFYLGGEIASLVAEDYALGSTMVVLGYRF